VALFLQHWNNLAAVYDVITRTMSRTHVSRFNARFLGLPYVSLSASAVLEVIVAAYFTVRMP